MNNASMTTAQAIHEMMSAWNASLAAAKQEFPSASEEQLYQIVKGVMDRAISVKPQPVDLRSTEGATSLAAEFDKKALETLSIPDSHVYVPMNAPQQTAWVHGRPGGSMSAFVRLMKGSCDEEQLHVEARVFMDTPRAILFAERGQRYAGKNSPIFSGDEKEHRFIYATNYAELFEKCIVSIGLALGRWERRAADARPRPAAASR